MVYVIVEIEREDITDIVTRLLGARHKINIVEDISVACGCDGQSKPKRPREASFAPPVFNASHLFSSSCSTPPNGLSFPSFPTASASASNGDLNGNLSSLAEMVRLATNPSPPSTSMVWQPSGECSASKRNNGVPYNAGALFPNVRMTPTSDEPKEEYPEGADMAIKCALCERTIALGTRPQNHSTRKYAHARCHGFQNRFECNLCHALFKNKRVTYTHNKTVHGENPAFQLIDRWNEEAQRELMLMVRKCFPKGNKAFVKASMDVLEEEEYTMDDMPMFVKAEVPEEVPSAFSLAMAMAMPPVETMAVPPVDTTTMPPVNSLSMPPVDLPMTMPPVDTGATVGVGF